jgi:hypothetical protein
MPSTESAEVPHAARVSEACSALAIFPQQALLELAEHHEVSLE